jgi:Ca2+-binding EF-hand superfamily protein
MNKTRFSRGLKTLVATAMVGAIFTTTSPAFADSSQEDLLRFVKMFDTNKDGMVSKTELMKRAEAMLANMPADKAGMVDSKKALAFLMELQKSDGGLGYMTSKADFMKKMEMMFDKMDTSKAGMLNKKQLEAFLVELMKSGG